jgi:hypothetical protein
MTQSQSIAMANKQPTVPELQALIQMLQAQVQALQNAVPAAQAAKAANQLVFTNMPQTLGVDNLIRLQSWICSIG